jgi:hypothetical protein
MSGINRSFKPQTSQKNLSTERRVYHSRQSVAESQGREVGYPTRNAHRGHILLTRLIGERGFGLGACLGYIVLTRSTLAMRSENDSYHLSRPAF